MDGGVFISYSREDKPIITQLVDYLTENDIPVWWDDHLEGGQVFRNIIANMIEKASCVIVAWSKSSVEKDWVRAEAEQGRQRKILVPVALDSNLEIPLPFSEYHQYDLFEDDFIKGKEIKKLLNTLKSLLKNGKPVQSNEGIPDETWRLGNAQFSTDRVRELVQKLGSLSEIMVLEAKPVEDIKSALKEVEKTYDVTNKTITKFLNAISHKGKIPMKPFIQMERGSLEKLIKKGHGHCTSILTIYTKVKGLRESIKSQLSTDQLQELDNVFSQLGNADGDLFMDMNNIGSVLTNESRIILNLLLADQEEIAQKRIIDDRIALQPLEQKMNTAYTELQEITQKIGGAVI